MSTQDIAQAKEVARAELDRKLERILDFSHKLHQNPEPGWEEVKASAWISEELRAVPGARVTHGLGELPTAVRAELGHGPLVLTICAEYDALPGVGHACGHNVIASAALGAFTALAPLVDQLDATVRLLGTPAEENGGGKIVMLEQGDFDGTHAAMMVHPGDVDNASMRPFACTGVKVRYQGRSAHASARPFEGINALDAMTIALTSIGLARQQFREGQQIHGFVEGAGTAPNVIPESASGTWMARAHDVDSLNEVMAVLRRCFDAGAVATGATLHFEEVGKAYLEMRDDDSMRDLFMANSAALGRELEPVGLRGGSTDMANVSHYYPTIHPMLSLGKECPPIHNAAFADAAASAAGDKAVRDGALAMAMTCIDLALDPRQRERLMTLGAKN
ncbi:amidohydrolase [Arthrobacter sp. MI7-26]|uniref:amidohydrolase n=1 Tax=Arthrobacter sp. MI7-26 TaxID=2993653 RepID=UPI002248827B|nr:amidohydrolase [Arthrobacter sp. MI7-26]MCX2746860.1 amidohydrolase [Arthrobacter sp. MI7-26]